MTAGRMERAYSAPGKLFLSGEYAVLWGGTARIAAVGPRTHAFVWRREDRQVHLVLEGGRLVGDATPLGVSWRGEVAPEFQFAARALDEALRAHGKEALGLDLLLSPSPAAPDGRKLGMGGSARACVLATEAARYALEERWDPLKLALLAHGQMQGLKGSGGDVAAIAAGGIVRYRRYPLEPLARASTGAGYVSALAAAPPVDLWRLPAQPVFLVYAYAGQSASTRAQIRHVEQRLSPEDRAAFVARSDEAGEVLEDGLLRGDFARLRDAVPRLHALLCGLGPLETEPMRRILALAASFGCVGKISGAGGGDGCVLFAPSAEVREELLAGLTARELYALPLELEPGLRGEASIAAELEGWL